MIKLLNQLEQVDRATPLARREDGKISGYSIVVRFLAWFCLCYDFFDEINIPAGIAQGTGPHEAPKASM